MNKTLLAFLPVLLLLSCARTTPDQGRFQAIASTLVAEGATASRSVIVIDPTFSFDQKSSSMRDDICQRLAARDIVCLDFDLGGEPDALPGDWIEGSLGHRINTTHSLLSVSVHGKGRKRKLSWRYTCGPLCGGGQDVEFLWSNDHWNHSVVSHVRF